VVSNPDGDLRVDAAFLAHPDLAEPIFDIGLEVQRGQVIQHQRQATVANRPRVAGLRDHGAVVAFDHPLQAAHERHPRRTWHAELSQHPHRVGLTGRLDDPGQHECFERVVTDPVEAEPGIDRQRLPHNQRRRALHQRFPNRPAASRAVVDRQHLLPGVQPGAGRLQQHRQLTLVVG
jgi:hypothetical protein